MKNIRLLILGLAFVVLVIVAFLLMQKPGEQSTTPGEGAPLVDLDSAQVSKVEITSPTHQLVFVKQGAQWYLEQPISYAADQRSVSSMIGQISSLRSIAVVSANPEKRGLFQVDSTGTVVTFTEGTEAPVSLVIGKMGSSYSETYVRLAKSDDVHLANASLTFVGTRSADDWRDKTILKVPREEIHSVDYQYGDTAFTLAFHDSLWMIGERAADDKAVNSLLSSLADIQADGFVDVVPQSPPSIHAVVSYAGKQLRFFDGPVSDTYLVRSSTADQWYEMKSWRAKQILKRKDELQAK